MALVARFVPSLDPCFWPCGLGASCLTRHSSRQRSIDTGRAAGSDPVRRGGRSRVCNSGSWPSPVRWGQLGSYLCAAVCLRAVALSASRSFAPSPPRTSTCTSFLSQDSESPGRDSEARNLVVCPLNPQMRDSCQSDGPARVDSPGIRKRPAVAHARKRESFDLNPGASSPQQLGHHLDRRAECLDQQC